MHMFYRIIKGIYQFAVNLHSYIPTKYYWNRSTSDLVIAKSKRVNFFLKHSVLLVVLLFLQRCTTVYEYDDILYRRQVENRKWNWLFYLASNNVAENCVSSRYTRLLYDIYVRIDSI